MSTQLQRETGLNTSDGAVPHDSTSFKKTPAVKLAKTTTSDGEKNDDELDFHKSNFRGVQQAESNIWDPDFLAFSKYLRNEFFKDYSIKKMQALNRHNFFSMIVAVAAQVGSYVVLRRFFADYWMYWAFPLFLLQIYLVQFGEIIHTRAHWPRLMTGSDNMDNFVDTVSILLTGTSKESFRRRHVVAHYSDIGNIARVFSDVWLPFVQFPATFYVMPHKLLQMFLNVDYCKRENLNRRQIFSELILFYLYLVFATYEVVYLKSCFLAVYHMGSNVFYYGAQVMGAMGAHSGVDKRNSFNSNGLFDADTAKGLFSLSIRFIDFFANKGLSNHGIHHAHSQLPVPILNQNVKKINKYVLENYKNVRYNNLLTHRIYSDLLPLLPEPKWYDYVLHTCCLFFFLFWSSVTVTGLPIMPPFAFEPLIVDYRFYMYFSTADIFARLTRMWEALEILRHKNCVVNPNAYCIIVQGRYEYMKKYLETHKPNMEPPSVQEMKAMICPQFVYDFNVKPYISEGSKKND